MNTKLILTALALPLAIQAQQPPPTPRAGVDSYPEDLAAEILEQREQETSAILKAAPEQKDFIYYRRRWRPGSTIVVAFYGGTPQLHRSIAKIAREWEKYANLHFDFGYDPRTKSYRTWHPNDSRPNAQIRISFNQQGYWSNIGTDSLIRAKDGTIRPSMNFGGFEQEDPALQDEFLRGTVLHEFGHAIALSHEHERDICFKEIRWEPGPNGEPDVFEVFRRWQDWDRTKVINNLRPPESRLVDITSPLDRKSCMFYAMPAQSFIRGKQSPCFIEDFNNRISEMDAHGARVAYPQSPTAAVEATTIAQNIFSSANSNSVLTDAERSALKASLAALEESRRPLLYIQIYDEGQRPFAREIQALARAEGFLAPGIENVKSKAAKPIKVSEIRVFRNEDKRHADRTARLISEQLSVTTPVVRLIPGLAKSAAPNQIEVWLADNSDTRAKPRKEKTLDGR